MHRIFRNLAESTSMNVHFRSSFNVEVSCKDSAYDSIHNPHLFTSSSGYYEGLKEINTGYSLDTDCKCRKDFSKHFKKLWTLLSYFNQRYGETEAVKDYHFNLRGNLGKGYFYETFYNLDALHDFLAKHDLIPAEVLQGELQINYTDITDMKHTLSSITSVNFNKHLNFLKDADKSSIQVHGRLGARFVNEKFEDANALNNYLSEHFSGEGNQKVMKIR